MNIMFRRQWGPQFIFPVLVLALFLAGCPKRPASTTAAAPGGPTPGVLIPDAKDAPGTTGLWSGGGTTGRTGPSGYGLAARSVTPLPPGTFTSANGLRSVHFDFDKYTIRAQDAVLLDENAKWMRANPNSLVLIEGHADERGTNEYNLALGERRAQATMNYLIARGVPASRLMLISYGEERPVCDHRSEYCWAQNRRAHFLIRRD